MREAKAHPRMDAIQQAVARAHGVAFEEWLRHPDFFEIELAPDSLEEPSTEPGR